MHPLLKRILIRGPLIFVALAVFAYFIAVGFKKYLSTGPVEIDWNEQGIIFGAIRFALAGVVLLAFLEWVSYLREQRKAKPPVG